MFVYILFKRTPTLHIICPLGVIHWWPMDSRHKRPAMRKVSPICIPYDTLILPIVSKRPMGLLPGTQNCGSRLRWKCRDRFPRHRLQRKPLVSDTGMHHGTCVTHVPWCMSGSLIRGYQRKRSRLSRCMRNPQLYISGKWSMEHQSERRSFWEFQISIISRWNHVHLSSWLRTRIINALGCRYNSQQNNSTPTRIDKNFHWSHK